MSENTDEKRMDVDTEIPGYAHVIVQGTCGPNVTTEDVRRRFYHSYFGGRDEWVRNGRFGVTIHTD